MILKDGCISASEPLMCTCHAELHQEARTLKVLHPWKSGDLMPFSVGFLKGKAQMHTLLTIMAICFDNEVVLQECYDTVVLLHRESAILEHGILPIKGYCQTRKKELGRWG